MANLSRFFSTARAFFLHHLLHTVNKNLSKTLFFRQIEFYGQNKWVSEFSYAKVRAKLNDPKLLRHE